MKYKILITNILLILIITTLLSGCTTFNNFQETFFDTDAEENERIRIGVFEPLSGSEKENGELELRGIELAHELFPKVLGKDVELVYADNKSDVDVAATVAEDLVEKKVSVVLGSYGSFLSIVGGEYFTEAKNSGYCNNLFKSSCLPLDSQQRFISRQIKVSFGVVFAYSHTLTLLCYFF
jgi:hypothetical protein